MCAVSQYLLIIYYSDCKNCIAHVKPLTDILTILGLPLCIQSLAVRHQREGWSLVRVAAKLIYSCPTDLQLSY